MVKRSKRRGWPMPDASVIKRISLKLEEALANELDILYNYSLRSAWEVTTSARDSAVHKMRFLRIWFGVPQSVFFSAVSYLDQFLSMLRVKEKYLACLTISCYYVAAKVHGFEINPNQLVQLSQTRCTAGDMKRMSEKVMEQLNPVKNDSYNALNFLKLYSEIIKFLVPLKAETILKKVFQHLSTRLEILISNSSCAQYKPSILALTFLQFEVESLLLNKPYEKVSLYTNDLYYITVILIELQNICKVDLDEYKSCTKAVAKVLQNYDKQKKLEYSQKLEWRFSSSTHYVSEHIQNYRCALATVKEEEVNTIRGEEVN